MKNDALKKNLFWILSGVGLFLTFLALILVMVLVGGDVDAKSAVIGKELADINAVKPKGVDAIKTMGDQDKEIAVVKQKLWEKNWQRQLDLFPWPKDSNNRLEAFQTKYQKFGEPMVEQNSEFDVFKDPAVYEAAYQRLADGVGPTQFKGGTWKSVLRYVNNWGVKKPTVPQIWLALEDLWVQTAVLEPVKAINSTATAFTLVGDPAKEPKLKRRFQSRVWDVALEIPTEGPDANKIIKGTVTNRTDRLQPFGQNRTLTLNVYTAENAAPVKVRVQGDFLTAKTAKPPRDSVALSADPRFSGIPLGQRVDEIVRVEVVPDARTVPVRRVDVVELSKFDARHAAAALKPPTKGEFQKLAEALQAVPAAGAGPGPGATGMSSGSEGAGRPGLGGLGGPGSAGGAGGAGAGKSGDPAVVLDANLNRYLDVTDQVRRMPVAVVIVVDQMYLQDALAAYANSALRFQVTQYHWKRFRDKLDGPAGTTPGGPGGSSGPDGSSGGSTSDFGSGSEGLPGAGRGPAGASGGPGYPGGLPGSPGGLPGYPGGGLFPGMGSSGGPGYPGSSSYAGVSEGQLTSGLVELTIYGIVTLYEKYEDTSAGQTPPK